MKSWREGFLNGVIEFLRWMLYVYFKIFHRLELRGREHLPKSGPVLIAPNHQTSYDGMLVGLSLPPPIWCVVMAKYFRMPVIGWLLRTFRGIPIEGPRDIAAYRRILEKLRDGAFVVLFPEGHRTTDGHLKEFQPGAARAALTAGVPILPVSLLGGFEAWPRQQPFPRLFRKLVVQYHPMIPCAVPERTQLKARVAEVTEELQEVLEPPVEAWVRGER